MARLAADFVILVLFVIISQCLSQTFFVAALERLDLDRFAGKKILFVGAHPDDVEGMAAGTVSQLTAIAEVGLLIFTNGDKGGSCYHKNNISEFFQCPKEDIAALRRGEQYAAAKFMGIARENVRFFDLEDGMLESYTYDSLMVKATAHVRTFQPYAVFAWFPSPVWSAPPQSSTCPQCYDDLGYHPDHQYSGKVMLDVVRSFSPQLSRSFDELLYAGVKPWAVTEFYMFALTEDATHFTEISDSLLKTKTEAMMIHHSQIEGAGYNFMYDYFDYVTSSVAREYGLSGRIEAFTAYF